MPKRKRDPRSTADDSDSDSHSRPHSAAPYATAKQRKQLPPKIDLGKKSLTKALQVSRGFERQKLSRRRKTAEKEGKATDVSRIDGEIEALKKVNYHLLAETHLYKTLLRIKSIAQHPALPPWIKVPEAKTPAPDAATMNVQARLFNANPTKVAMGAVIKEIRGILELGEEGGKGPSAKKVKSEEEKKAKVKKAASLEESSGEDEDEGEEADDDNGGGEEGAWDSEEFAGFSDRIAASSDDEDEEGGGGGEEDDVASKLKRPYQPVRDLSFTPPSSREASPASDPEFSGAESVSASESPEPAPKTKAKAQAPIVIANKSTFLPSLSAAGYISGSDSEAEDLDEQVAPAKKNRRGQRARQQLWEKKYGAGAKHVEKQKEKEKNDRNAGWDAQRGAVDGDRKGKFGRNRSGGGRGPQASDANLIELGKKKDHRDDAGKLHPSWEAKKKAKEKAATVAFQGTKITFD